MIFLRARLSNVLLRGALIAFVIQGFGYGLKYLTLVVLARLMGTAEYGSYIYSVGWAQVLSILAGLGLTTLVLRFVPEYTVKHSWGLLRGLVNRSRLWTLAAGIAIGLFGVLIVAILLPSDQDSKTLLLGLWLVPVIATVTIQMELIRGTRQIHLAYLPSYILHPILLIGIAWVVVAFNTHLFSWMGIFISLSAYLIVIAVQEYLISHTFPADINLAQLEVNSKEWLRVSFPLLLVTFAYMLMSQIDFLTVGSWLGTKSAGVYSVASRTASFVGFVLLAANAITAPTISEEFTRNRMLELEHMVNRVSHVTAGVSLIVAIIFAAFGHLILRLFGADFQEGYIPLVILCLGELVNAAAGPVGYLVNLTGNERAGAFVSSLSILFNLALLAGLLPVLGLTGAAIASVLTKVVWNVWLSILIYRRLGIRTFLMRFIPYQA